MPDAPPFFLAFAGAGLVGVVGMALARKSRGNRALLLAGAFLVFALLNLGVYFAWHEAAVWTLAVLLVLLLLADIVGRAARK